MESTIDGSDLCFPQMLNASCKKIIRPYFTTMLVYTVLYVISLVTAAMNLLVIISISHYKQLRTTTNLLLLSLAVSDFCVGLLMFIQILFVDGCWLFGDILCIVYLLVSYTVTCASLGTIVLISVDRYIAICQPLHYYTKVTEHKVKFGICLCWFVSTFYSVILLKDSMEKPGSFNSCSGECVIGVNYGGLLTDVFISLIIPVSAISVLYMQVFVVVVTRVRTTRSQITAGKSQRTVFANKSELKAARTLGVVIVMFIICLCPYYVVIIGQNSYVDTSSAAIVIYLFFFNSCLNPLIYTFFYPWFRKCLKHIVTLQILQPGSSRANIMSDRKSENGRVEGVTGRAGGVTRRRDAALVKPPRRPPPALPVAPPTLPFSD
ncbi:trace amine-associated receptor 13c-like [Eucyclogobius newberryi]|uniref:trace amine-associated receptor 13c-like n=1 Tax=Eucyclogobius newberryi TaxID=166745 RepID=UPI003B5B4DC1